MLKDKILDILITAPIIAATDSSGWEEAVNSKSKILFHLNADILTVEKEINKAKEADKYIFIHMDLVEGIGKDKKGIEWLYAKGADGIISTRNQLIRSAKEIGILAVQRFFILDSKGMHSIAETLESTSPDFIEIMPGVIPKALKLFENREIPVIAGGLIENKTEITSVLGNGAIAVSTGKKSLWNLL